MSGSNPAHAALNYAVKVGTVIRPDTCSSCGQTGVIEGHHANGYEPEHWLDVVWLCRKCHKVAHPTPEALAAGQAKGVASKMANRTPEERSAMGKKAWATRRARNTPEELAEQMAQLHRKMTPEQRRQRGLKAGAASAAATRRRLADG